MQRNGSSKELRFASEIPGIILKESAEILRTPLIKNEPGKGSQIYRMVSIYDLPEYGYINAPEKTIRIKASLSRAEKYLLHPCDVLLTIVGTIGKVGIIGPDLAENWISSSNMLIIRFNNQKEDNALAFTAYIHSDKGRQMLNKLTHGTTIPLLSKKEFSKIVIPKLTVALKRKVKALYAKERKLFNQIEKDKESIAKVRANYLGENNQ